MALIKAREVESRRAGSSSHPAGRLGHTGRGSLESVSLTANVLTEQKSHNSCWGESFGCEGLEVLEQAWVGAEPL